MEPENLQLLRDTLSNDDVIREPQIAPPAERRSLLCHETS
jgi:hypothetical protein